MTAEPAYRCRDALVIAAAPEVCFAPLTDLASYPRWWTLVAVEPVAGGPRLVPGVRFRFGGQRPGGTPVRWTAEVRAVEPPRRIALEYVDGDLLGPTAWELEPVGGGTRVAYVYAGVRANADASRRSFERFGTRLHSAAMQVDALAGLARLAGGPGREMDDAGWRTHVAARMAAAVRAL